jgi:quinol monooxygenase YgiN
MRIMLGTMSFAPSNGRNGMLIIAGHLIVDPADRDHYVADCATAVKQARRAPGCLDFALTADSLDPARVNVYERWESDAELANFRVSGPDEATQARILRAEVHKYRISVIEAP